MDRRNILIVEDEGITAAYLQKTLTSLGYQALDPCASGEAALEQAQALLPDLVLMDIRLEGSMDGIECAGQIHKKLGIPVIMLTANDDAEIMDLSKDSVPYGYIVKPFQDKNLRAAIEIALNLHDMEIRLRESEARYRSVVEQTSESIFLIDPQSLNVLGANAAFCRLLGYQPEEMSLLRLFDVVAEEPDAIDLHIKQILEMGVLNLLESNYRRKDREIVPVEVNANLIHFQSQQVISMLVRDISERKRMDRELWQSNQQLEAQVRSRTLDLTKTNLALREEVVQRQQAEIRLTELAQTLEQRVKDRTGELLALYHIMVIIRESQSIEEILSLSLAHVLESLDSGTLGGALFLLSENGEGIERKIGLNLSDYEVSCLEQRLLEDRASLGSSLKEQTVNKTVITIKSCLGEGRNVLIIPLEVSGHTLGLLALVSKNQPLSSDEMKLAQSLVDHIATAVLNVRLNQRSREMVLLQERTRLARDLHDSVTQSLFSLTLFSDAARQKAAQRDLEKVKVHLDQIYTISTQALKDLRLMVFELHSPLIEKEGLIRALQQRLEAVEQRAGIQTSLQADLDIQLPLATQEGLYWIAQEALNNTLKHAGASSVQILCDMEKKNTIRFEITDDGVGFDPAEGLRTHGYGLTNMRERALKMNGSLKIDSSPGRGAKIIISIPLKEGLSA